jgi:hypothetical protein
MAPKQTDRTDPQRSLRVLYLTASWRTTSSPRPREAPVTNTLAPDSILTFTLHSQLTLKYRNK